MNLPQEIISYIYDFLDPRTSIMFSHTCKNLYTDLRISGKFRKYQELYKNIISFYIPELEARKEKLGQELKNINENIRSLKLEYTNKYLLSLREKILPKDLELDTKKEEKLRLEEQIIINNKNIKMIEYYIRYYNIYDKYVFPKDDDDHLRWKKCIIESWINFINSNIEKYKLKKIIATDNDYIKEIDQETLYIYHFDGEFLLVFDLTRADRISWKYYYRDKKHVEIISILLINNVFILNILDEKLDLKKYENINYEIVRFRYCRRDNQVLELEK